MNDNERLLDAIGEANEIHVPDILESTGDQTNHTAGKRRTIAIASAACAAVLVGTIAISSAVRSDVRITDEEFAQLLEAHRIYPEISDLQAENTALAPIASDIVFGDMGFEGYMVNDISELAAINPWSADKPLDVLPVYQNLSIAENCSVPVYLTQEEMEEMAHDAAYSLGIEVTDITVELVSDICCNPPEEAAGLPYCVEAACSGEPLGTRTVEIRVLGNGVMSIDFQSSIALPDKYSFTFSNTSDKQALRTLEYLSKEFQGLLQFKNPAVYSYGDRNIYGEQIRSYYVYEQQEDYRQDILSYNFTTAQFCCDDSGKLMMIWLNNPLAAAQNLGEYPIIDVREAEQLLCGGSYITTVPTEYLKNGEITADTIAKTELIYRSGSRDAYYQPYYRFYVALSDEYYAEGSRPEGIKEYGAFYVPAVESEYLSDLSVWDGSFN